MNCGCFSSLIPRVLTLTAVGLVVGAAHSWTHPVQLRLAETRPISSTNTPTGSGDPARSTTAPGPANDPAQAQGSGGTSAEAPLGLHISPTQTKKFWDDGVPFIDARLAKDFVKGHIPGAKNINPVNFNDPESIDALKYMDTSKPIVIYCGGGDCHDSENTAILFQQFGFTSFHIFTDGFPAWQAAGYEVELPADGGTK